MRERLMLQVEDLSKVYRPYCGEPVQALDHISFKVGPGEIVGLLGPNGAGKTTMIKCIAGLIRPTSGRIWIDGIDSLSHSRAALKKIAAVLEGNRNVYWRLTVRDNLEFFARLHGLPLRRVRTYIDELIELFQLSEKANTQARALSRGMQQKLAVACALVKQTPLLLLDEPTLGLDVETSYELRRILKEMAQGGERTILLSSHDMGVVQDIYDRVIILNRGRIVADDRVNYLRRLFEAQAYRIEIEGSLSPERERLLKERFGLVKISREDQRTLIEVDVLEKQRVYQIIELLKEDGNPLESVGRTYPDLEEIFLKVIRGGKNDREEVGSKDSHE